MPSDSLMMKLRRFDTVPACDRRIDGNQTVAYEGTSVLAHRVRNASHRVRNARGKIWLSLNQSPRVEVLWKATAGRPSGRSCSGQIVGEREGRRSSSLHDRCR